MIATFFDPKYKNLTLVAHDGSKEGIKNRVIEIMKDSENIHRSNNPLGAEDTALHHDHNMEVEKTHEEEMISDFLTSLEQERTQGDAWIKLNFSGSPLLMRHVKLSSNTT